METGPDYRFALVFLGPLYYMEMHCLKVCLLCTHMSYGALIRMETEVQTELLCWLHHMAAWNDQAIFGSTPDFALESNASLWEPPFQALQWEVVGHWPNALCTKHKCLEITAESFAVHKIVLSPMAVSCCAWTTSQTPDAFLASARFA